MTKRRTPLVRVLVATLLAQKSYYCCDAFMLSRSQGFVQHSHDRPTHSQPAVTVTVTATALWGRNSRAYSGGDKKNSDRAHIERTLEDMMDNDWRVFRARLVAQEKAESLQDNHNHNHHHHNNKDHSHKDEKLQKQGQLSDLLAGAISSIFSKKSANSNNKDSNIFEGDSIGRSTQVPFPCEDPFVSEQELPMLLKPTVTIDKRRWAHEIPHVEPGCVLIANEKLGGVFHQTVVLIIQHSENSGSTGIVINR